MTRRQRWWDIATDEGRRAVGFLAGLAAVIYWVAWGIRPDHILAGLVASLLFAQAFIPTRSSERRENDR